MAKAVLNVDLPSSLPLVRSGKVRAGTETAGKGSGMERTDISSPASLFE